MDTLTGSDDPLNDNKPLYTAVMFAILFNLLGGGTLAAALFTNYWFTTNTGARVGLKTAVEHDWECGQRCYKEVDTSGDWASAGDTMFALGLFALFMCVVGTIFQCCNLTANASRKKALTGCFAMDIGTLATAIGLGLYWWNTMNVRGDDTPDKNGIVTTWQPGSSFLGGVCACVLMAVGVASGVVAKPPPIDEGMEATVTLTSPEAKYQLARQTKGFAQAY